MFIILQSGCAPGDVERICHVAEGLGYDTRAVSFGEVPGVVISGYEFPPNSAIFASLPGVRHVRRVSRPAIRSDRSARPDGTVVQVGNVTIGAGEPTLIAGPCAVENEDDLTELVPRLRAAGAGILRGGAWKPRTSPYDFQGLGEEGLRMLARAGALARMPIITEAVDEASLALVEEYADIVQIGARNMQNYALLKRAGASRRPVFLKRGSSASLEEFLLAAEYVLSAGNGNVILCERGIRTFSTHSRYTLDLSIVPQLRKHTHLPIIVDPSHASGDSDAVCPLARAALAAGADGVMVEVHLAPERALSDGAQSLSVDAFTRLAGSLRALSAALAESRESVT